MHIDYYREFLVLARRLNYTEAANELHITQPALSKHIVALEREFDAELLVRDRRAVQLTEAGRILVGTATAMVDAYDRGQHAIAAITKEKPIRVDGILLDSTVSSIIALSSVLLNDQNHAPILFNRNEGKPLLGMLYDNEIDMVLAFESEETLEEQGLAFKPLVVTRFTAVVDRNHPLAKRASIHMEDLKHERLIKFIDEYSISGWKRIEQVCRNHGFIPNTRPCLGQAGTSYLTTQPEGDVLITQGNLKQLKYLEDINGTVAIPIDDKDATFVIYYIYKPENEQRLQPLIDALEESKEIIVRHRME